MARLLRAAFACTAVWEARATRLAFVISTHPANMDLIVAGRTSWRAGAHSFILTNGTTERELPSPHPSERWMEGPENVSWAWNNRAETRYTAAPMHANLTLAGDYDWLLLGDDNVVWFQDNVIALVRGLDPAFPHYITDAQFMQGDVNGSSGVACAFPEASEAPRKDRTCVRSPRLKPGQACTRAAFRATGVCGADAEAAPYGADWFNGDRGAIVSRGAMATVSVDDWRTCERCFETEKFRCYGGGDVRIGECLWTFGANRQGLAPTRPFTGHWGGDGAGEPDAFVFGTKYLETVVDLAESVARASSADGCDWECRWTLLRAVSAPISAQSKREPKLLRDLVRRFTHFYPAAKDILL